MASVGGRPNASPPVRDSLYESGSSGLKSSLVLTPEMARRLVEAWKVHGDSRTLRLLQGHKVPVIIAMKVLRFHRGDTMQRLKEDPYRLLSFSTDWNVVDNLARGRFEVAVDDPRRLAATVEQGLYDVIAQGHTAATVDMLFPAVTRLLQGNDPLVSKPDAQALAKRALTDLRNKSFFYSDETGCFHLRGAWSMEARVVKF